MHGAWCHMPILGGYYQTTVFWGHADRIQVTVPPGWDHHHPQAPRIKLDITLNPSVAGLAKDPTGIPLGPGPDEIIPSFDSIVLIVISLFVIDHVGKAGLVAINGCFIGWSQIASKLP